MNFTKQVVLISINEILVNPENPRHNPVMALDESIIMQQLISNKTDAKAMHKLIMDIYNNGWFPQSIITVTYDEHKKKYIAWDGNRRLTALKILQNPKLTENIKHFDHLQVTNIHALAKGITDQSFFTISCYVADNFKECANYIKSIHTTDTGALRWNSIAIRRFEDKLGVKNIFAQLQGYCPKAFANVNSDFPVSKFEKIANSKIGKEFLQIETSDGRVMPLEDINILNSKVSKIINDIKNNIITTDTISSSKKIKDYLYPTKNILADEDTFKNVSSENISNSSQNEKMNLNVTNDKPLQQIDLFTPNPATTIDKKLLEKTKLISKDTTLIFRHLNIDKLDRKNERALGIERLTYEIQQFSNDLYTKYPIAFCFLLRSILEQSAIYFLINKEKWNELIIGNSRKDLGLGKIIEYITKNKQNLLDNSTTRIWNICFGNTSNKDYLDLVIHQPHKISANADNIRHISDIGLFAIVQYFINN